MKQLRFTLTALLISLAFLAKAEQGMDQPANDKESLGIKVGQLLDRAERQGMDLGAELEMVLRVGAGGKLEVLDILGETKTTVEVLRMRLETAEMLLDASLQGRSFRFHFQPDGPES